MADVKIEFPATIAFNISFKAYVGTNFAMLAIKLLNSPNIGGKRNKNIKGVAHVLVDI